MSMENNFSDLNRAIQEAENIIVLSHVNPDGDTLGSNLALSIAIENNYNKKVESVYVGHIPSVYSYLPDFKRFKDANLIDDGRVYDLAIAVDVASKDRLVYSQKFFESAKKRINIDHHKTNIAYADINIIDGKAACVGLILYKIFNSLNINITVDIARCLYTSLMTDTGSFRYENTNPDVFYMAADLVSKGVIPYQEYRACYETKPQNMFQFQSYILCKTQFYDDGKIALSSVTKEDIEKYNASDDYTEGIVEQLRTSKDVEIAGLLKETKEGYTKVSLRSKTRDLTPITRDFNGGGHSFAAGCTIKKPLLVAYDKLLERIQSELK